jgi:hypothetical protein
MDRVVVLRGEAGDPAAGTDPTGRTRTMPHVELLGNVGASAVQEHLEPVTAKVGGCVFKTRACYLRSDGRDLLVECLVVEGFLKQEFLVEIRDRDGGVMVRLYGGSRVQRTGGVKSFLAWLARRIAGAHPDLTVGTTNLGSFLGEGGGAAPSGERATEPVKGTPGGDPERRRNP